MKKKTSAIIASLATIAMCTNLAVGATYALFTSESEVNIAVSSGKVDVKAALANLEYQTLTVNTWTPATDNKTTFDNLGGSAEINGATLTLDKIVPGDAVKFDVKITNESTVNVKYRVLVENDESKDLGLFDGLDVKVNDQEFDGEAISKWTELAPTTVDVETVNVEIALPNTGDPAIDNQYNGQNNSCEIVVSVEAVQGNATVKDPADEWDGTADASWYDENETEFLITSAEQFAGFAELVDAGNTFEGKTVKLEGDLDLYKLGDNGEPISFDPIGDESPFKGTFDGQGYAIENMYQSGWAFGYEWGSYGSVGLFGEVVDATIKNVTVKGAEVQIEGGDVGGIVGSASGTCVFEDITITDSAFGTYNNGNGGIIGWSGAGNYTFKNIKITDDVVLGGLWGSFDSSIGGVVGQAEPGATYNFENVEVSCRIDAYNDCTASYDYYNYRMCGMLIGRLEETTTIDGANYPDTSKYNITCKNVVVNYGDWMNYHYCEPTPGLNGGRGMRVEPGYAYDGLPADYDHSQCVDNCMNLIPFDQIFGGAQLGVKGLKTYDGVTVNYPASYTSGNN